MKNIFYLLLTTFLFAFVANQSFAFDTDYDPVKVEQSIFVEYPAYCAEPIQLETQKEFAEPLLPKMQIQDYTLLCSYFLDGSKCRDNIEGHKQVNFTENTTKNYFIIVATATEAKRDR